VRLRSALLSVSLTAILAACGGTNAPSSPDPAPLAWESVQQTFADATVVIERVAYRSDGLRVHGQVCRPPTGGPYPVLVWNHGGFDGLGDEWNGGLCRDYARLGNVVVESSYRGEDGSEGAVEACLGEVSDVLRMLDITLAQPYADRRRVVLAGASHGGAITTRAFQRGAPVHAAIDIFGFSDLGRNFDFWRAQVAAGSPNARVYQDLLDRVSRAAGGTPTSVPAAYAARSPATFSADLARREEPLLIVHGVEDPLIPPSQSCRLAALAGGFAARHVAAAPDVVLQTSPRGCEAEPLSWLPGPRPGPTWPGNRHLLVYDTVGHDFNGLAGQAMLADVSSFLAARTPRLGVGAWGNPR
jgi:dienelactone hydrolase